MLIKKDQAKMNVNSKSCLVKEYILNSDKYSIAEAFIDGRYPEDGKSVNKKVDQVFYVIKGGAEIEVGNKIFVIKSGDVLIIKKGLYYKLQAKKLKVLVLNVPAWSVKQYMITN